MRPSLKTLLLFLFLCSGATALVYEVVWSKFLSQMLGSTVYAQTVVLAVFMGGLALGNRLAGKWADTVDRPVKIYGILEIGIGLYGCLFFQLYTLADKAFVALGAPVIEHGWMLLGLKAIFSVALLLLPTVLMGCTLPLLAAWLKRHYQEAGRQSALFYAINSIGAVIGAGLAGFYLVQEWGLAGSLLLVGTVNLLVGGTAFVMDRYELASPASAAREVAPAPAGSWFWAALLVGITGGISMGLEVLASRSLALIFGSSLQSFAVVLMGFILGIGLGSTAISAARLQRIRSEWLIVGLLCAAALWVGALVFNIEQWVYLYAQAKEGLSPTLTGYFFHQFLTAGFALVVLGVPAALIGSVLPLMIRILAPATEGLGRTVGRLLTWNTCGAVAGVLLTGFVLMPTLGLRSAFLVLAVGLTAGAFLVASRIRSAAFMGLCGASATLLLLAMVSGAEDWRHVMSSGVFRWRGSDGVSDGAMETRKRHVKMLFYEDAPDATVSVEEGDGVRIAPSRSLRINGKPDASSANDMCTQLLSGHLPLLARPDSKDVFILGLGSGITGGAVVAHPITNLVIAENCEPVFRAARHFDRWSRGVLTNAVVRPRLEDARTLLKLSPQKYDVLITEPSNPWTAGIGSVFTLEFYELAVKRLKPGGIILQWFHIYENSDSLVALVLRTVGRVFPFMEIWDCGSGDVLIMASQQAWDASPDALRIAFNRPEVRKDMEGIGIVSPEALLLRQCASQRTAFAIAHPSGPIQTDMFPVLEYESPKAFFVGTAAQIINGFDERVRQERNAPEEKRKVLAGLKPEEVTAVFSRYTSNNPDLLDMIAWQLDRDKALSGYVKRLDDKPFILRATAPSARAFQAPTNATETTTNMLFAKWLIERGDVAEGAAIIEKLLLNPADVDWLPANYAAFAAEACLQSGDPRKAGELLILGLKYAPYDPQLLYLGTIVQRELSLKQARKRVSSLN